MKPPATCAELVRRLKAIAVPMHGQAHHDVRLAAAVLEAIDGSHWIANSAIDIVRHNDRSLYFTEPEGER
jgi:hypothetical protein